MLTFIQYIYAIIIGLVSGAVGGSVGTSGSEVIIPGLLVSGIVSTYKMAAGTTLLTILAPLSIGAVYTYYKTGNVQVDAAVVIIIAYVIASTFAAMYVVKYVSNKTLILAYAIYVLLLSVYFFYKYFNYKKEAFR